ncbi:MAG TPA: glycosyltransferase, partial [Blastocatellia bacterium]|nr:glycosyltransferase [Blastocatellia bacterium]
MRDRPDLLILTSSFPRDPKDETCGYIREFARQLSKSFNVRVLAPPDPLSAAWPEDNFALRRSPSLVPSRFNWFESGKDLNDLLRAGPVVKLFSLISMAFFVLAALRLSRRADVICSHWMAPSGLTGALASLLFGKPHIIIEHSGGLHLLARIPGGRLLIRFIVKHSRKVITVSHGLKKKLLNLYPGAAQKTEVIPMGTALYAGSRPVPVPAIDNSNRSGAFRRALFIGRLTEIKGVECLIRAVDGMEDIELIVAGDGERRTLLEDMATSLALRPSFPGRVDAEAKAELLACCDFVVIPSLVLPDGRAEGLPVVCLESLAAGRPVIASRSGGLEEVIIDGYNGLLFDPGDADGLASRIRMLIDNPE